MIKDVALVLEPGSEATARYALSAARLFDAHVTALGVVVEPTGAIGIPGASAALVLSLLDKARDEVHSMLNKVGAQAREFGVAVESELTETTMGEADRTVARILRDFDLTVVGQRDPDQPDRATRIIETALFRSGRPVLIVPYIQRDPMRLGNVVVAWDGGAQAARALGDAMPWLLRANRVELATVGAADGGHSAAKAARHLARHGILAQTRVLPDGDVAAALLSYAADAEADLLVMGGYGHSRFREVVLGGATRGILEAMTLPVLMSH
jgi:nucleotide-binding universal stress UspA family protein